MKILLVRPPRIKKAITIGEFMFCEPLGLECLYAVLSPDHDVRILDMMIEETDIAAECLEWRPDVLGLTSLCVDVPNVIRLAREVKAANPEIIILAGGTQTFVEPSAFHDEAIDHVLQYTTTANLQALFASLSEGGPVPMIEGIESRENGFRSTGVHGRNEYIVPDISCTKGYRRHYSYFGFKPCAIIQTSQGCSKQCRFCLRWRIEGGHEVPQDMDVVFSQIQRVPEPSIMILDNDFLCDGGRIDALCDRLEKHSVRKNFLCYGTVCSIQKNREQVGRFAENGLSAVLVGYESFSADELESYQKKSTINDNLEVSRFLKDIGVDAWASFIMHPNWTVADFKKFRKYIRLLKPEVSSMTPLTPFPTLPLYEEYHDRLIVNRDDYEKWSFGTVSIMPSRMSLRRYYFEILKSNFYVNLFTNNTAYLVRKFGIKTLIHLLAGSIRLGKRYALLMLRAHS